jgi:hypothetical protein
MDFILVKPLGISLSFGIFGKIDNFGFVNSLDISRLSATQTGSGKHQNKQQPMREYLGIMLLGRQSILQWESQAMEDGQMLYKI